jgi:Protein of unknown function (DUF3568)
MRGIVLGIAALAAVGSGGCMTVGLVNGPLPTTGAFAYSGGRATQSFPQPLEKVQTAVVESMGDLGIHSVRQINDPTLLTFDGKTADNRRALITLQAPTGPTIVSVRFGLWGDEAMSRAYMDRIGIRLGLNPPKPLPTETPSTPGSNPYLSRSGVPTSTMLRDQADAGYRDTPIP